MTKKQEKALERNFRIMQFRGCASRVVGMIPPEVVDKLEHCDRMTLIRFDILVPKITKILNDMVDCRHWYDDSNICILCEHKKYSRDKKGKKSEINKEDLIVQSVMD